jgi:SAM-dependent methyltransferase
VTAPQGGIPFGLYAEVYDLLYADKDYAAESAFVAGLIGKSLARADGARVVDLACGTGRHAFELTRLGFRVTGSDASEAMITTARSSAARDGLPVRFFCEPFQTCQRIGGTYDAALAMFASLGYLVSNEELAATFAGVRELLEPGGLFIFDVWNGFAVLRDYSPVRMKRAAGPNTSVIRISRTKLDEIRQVATVKFDFIIVPRGGEMVEFSETHLVRFFFPQELHQALTVQGFEVLLQCPFLDATRALEPTDWNATFVARKR